MDVEIQKRGRCEPNVLGRLRLVKVVDVIETMILEAVTLHVKPGMEAEFEAAFKQASALISAIEGYLSHELHRCMEAPGKYLLLVRWKTLEAHTVTFRQSPEFQQWKQLLHHFYDPFPVIEHFEEIMSTSLPEKIAARK